jgi:hypothetical protein
LAWIAFTIHNVSLGPPPLRLLRFHGMIIDPLKEGMPCQLRFTKP